MKPLNKYEQPIFNHLLAADGKIISSEELGYLCGKPAFYVRNDLMTYLRRKIKPVYIIDCTYGKGYSMRKVAAHCCPHCGGEL